MLGSGDKKPIPHKRALLFVDNSGADVVLGMLPLARELLRRGTEVSLRRFGTERKINSIGSCLLSSPLHATICSSYLFSIEVRLSSDRKCSFQVVLVGNSLPAINDVTAMELPDIVVEAAKVHFFPVHHNLAFSMFNLLALVFNYLVHS